VRDISFEEEAEDCRRQALAYVGQPEASFLMRVAREFDRLAHEPRACRVVPVDAGAQAESLPAS
jgi:hypothetical protein